MAVVSTHAFREEDLIDEADLDSLVRDAIGQVQLLHLVVLSLDIEQLARLLFCICIMQDIPVCADHRRRSDIRQRKGWSVECKYCGRLSEAPS